MNIVTVRPIKTYSSYSFQESNFQLRNFHYSSKLFSKETSLITECLENKNLNNNLIKSQDTLASRELTVLQSENKNEKSSSHRSFSYLAFIIGLFSLATLYVAYDQRIIFPYRARGGEGYIEDMVTVFWRKWRKPTKERRCCLNDKYPNRIKDLNKLKISLENFKQNKIDQKESIEEFGNKKLIENFHKTTESYSSFYCIGKGHVKTVFKATNEISNKSIAISEIFFKRNQYAKTEISVTKEISDKNISGIIPMGLVLNSKDEKSFLVTKYCNKGSLQKSFKTLDRIHKFQALISTWNTLNELHKNGYIHGDVSSGNILVHENMKGELKFYLSDFGCAEKLSDNNNRIFVDNFAFGMMLSDFLKIEVLNDMLLYKERKSNDEIKKLFFDTELNKSDDLDDMRIRTIACELILKPSEVNTSEVAKVLEELKNK